MMLTEHGKLRRKTHILPRGTTDELEAGGPEPEDPLPPLPPGELPTA